MKTINKKKHVFIMSMLLLILAAGVVSTNHAWSAGIPSNEGTQLGYKLCEVLTACTGELSFKRCHHEIVDVSGLGATFLETYGTGLSADNETISDLIDGFVDESYYVDQTEMQSCITYLNDYLSCTDSSAHISDKMDYHNVENLIERPCERMIRVSK